jgi:hypothetical protein
MAPAVWNRRNDVPRNGRCRMHGGLSTGPRTEEGLQRTLEAMRVGRTRSLEGRGVKDPDPILVYGTRDSRTQVNV